MPPYSNPELADFYTAAEEAETAPGTREVKPARSVYSIDMPESIPGDFMGEYERSRLELENRRQQLLDQWEDSMIQSNRAIRKTGGEVLGSLAMQFLPGVLGMALTDDPKIQQALNSVGPSIAKEYESNLEAEHTDERLEDIVRTKRLEREIQTLGSKAGGMMTPAQIANYNMQVARLQQQGLIEGDRSRRGDAALEIRRIGSDIAQSKESRMRSMAEAGIPQSALNQWGKEISRNESAAGAMDAAVQNIERIIAARAPHLAQDLPTTPDGNIDGVRYLDLLGQRVTAYFDDSTPFAEVNREIGASLVTLRHSLFGASLTEGERRAFDEVFRADGLVTKGSVELGIRVLRSAAERMRDESARAKNLVRDAQGVIAPKQQPVQTPTSTPTAPFMTFEQFKQLKRSGGLSK